MYEKAYKKSGENTLIYTEKSQKKSQINNLYLLFQWLSDIYICGKILLFSRFSSTLKVIESSNLFRKFLQKLQFCEPFLFDMISKLLIYLMLDRQSRLKKISWQKAITHSRIFISFYNTKKNIFFVSKNRSIIIFFQIKIFSCQKSIHLENENMRGYTHTDFWFRKMIYFCAREEMVLSWINIFLGESIC